METWWCTSYHHHLCLNEAGTTQNHSSPYNNNFKKLISLQKMPLMVHQVFNTSILHIELLSAFFTPIHKCLSYKLAWNNWCLALTFKGLNFAYNS